MKKKLTAKKISEFLYTGIISIFSLAIILYLVFLSCISTSHINNQEKTYYVSDSPFRLIIPMLLLSALGVFLLRFAQVRDFIHKINNNKRIYLLIRTLLLIIIGGFALFWVLNSKIVPVADQSTVQRAATAFLNGDFSLLDNDQYAGVYQNQLGFIGFSMVMQKIFGTEAFVIIQVINVFALVMLYREMCEICSLLGIHRIIHLLLLIEAMLFFPAYLYCSFVYGNIIGLALSVFAIRHEINYLKNGKVFNAVLSSIGIILAIMAKQNYLVFAIGMLLATVKEIFGKKKVAAVSMAFMTVFSLIIASSLPAAAAREYTGKPLDQGANSWSWIAMGLQESNMAPGWYNAYNWKSYFNNDCNSEAQGEEAKHTALSRLNYFRQNPGYALMFFTRKTASQWNNPTFQCFWTVRLRQNIVKDQTVVEFFKKYKHIDTIAGSLNVLHFLILFGSLLYLVFCRKEKFFSSSLILFMIFVGGFVFHLFWEGKCQYVLSYFMLLLPYAATGFGYTIRSIYQLIETKGTEKYEAVSKPFLKDVKLFMILVTATFAILSLVYGGHRADTLWQDTQTYGQYLADSIEQDNAK